MYLFLSLYKIFNDEISNHREDDDDDGNLNVFTVLHNLVVEAEEIGTLSFDAIQTEDPE